METKDFNLRNCGYIIKVGSRFVSNKTKVSECVLSESITDARIYETRTQAQGALLFVAQYLPNADLCEIVTGFAPHTPPKMDTTMREIKRTVSGNPYIKRFEESQKKGESNADD